MKQIIKNKAPKIFEEFCNKPFAIYDGSDFPKEELRQSLLVEQGHLCCYCLKRIPELSAPYMKVEHFKSQESFGQLQITYTNLFGACTGNEGQPKIKQTCDTKKGKEPLSIDLLSNAPNCETLFKYNAEGEISAIDNSEDINRQLNDVLNLNMQTLKDGRRQVYLEVQKRVEAESRQLGGGQLKIKFFEQERQKWLTRIDNKFKPFCMVAIYYLTKKIKQHQN